MHRTIVEIQMELGCKASKIVGSTDIDKVYFDLEKQVPAGMPDRHPAKAGDRPNTDSDGHSSGGANPQRIPNTNGATGPISTRSRTSRGLTEQDIQRINECLFQEAEHAAPLPPDYGGDSQAETAAREILGRTGTSRTTVGTGNVVSGEEKGAIDIGKMKGCAKRMKQDFNVSLSLALLFTYPTLQNLSHVLPFVPRNGKLANEIS